jgi:methionyl-tRNA formyltransferase
MISKNKFFINNIRDVIFLGQHENLKDLIEINKSLKIKTTIITTIAQKKKIDKKIDFQVFNKIDEKFKKFIKSKFSIEKTLFISIAARYIFKENTIQNFFKNNLVNIHNGRLPLDAGGGGFTWKILREDRIDNNIIHLITKKIDQGPILSNITSLIPKKCQTPHEIETFSNINLVKLYSDFIKNIKKNKKFNLKHQPDYIGRYNPRINSKKSSFIDWSISPYDLLNFINAFDEPFVGASTFLNNGNFGKLYLKSCQLHGGDSSNHPYMAGIVSRCDRNWILVSTSGKHMLIVEKVINSKGKNIINQIKVGDRFITSPKYIYNSLKKRTFYSSKGLKS